MVFRWGQPDIGSEALPLNYRAVGEGPAVTLIHGFTASLRYWPRVTHGLARAGYRAISLDLCGHGGSPKPADPAAYAIPALTADVCTLLDSLGIDRSVLVGHSMGGYVAQEFAFRHPEGLLALVIVDVGYGRRFATPEEAGRRLALLERTAREEGLAGLFELTFGRLEYRSAAVRQAAKEAFMQMPVEAYLGCQRAMVEWGSHLDRLAGVTAPTLLIAGANGTNIAVMEEMAAVMPDAELIVIEGAGHNVFLDRPQEFNRVLLDFLTRISPVSDHSHEDTKARRHT